MDTMIELPAMRRSAELAPNTADADSRTVEVVWSAGARVRRATFFGEPYDEELSLDPVHVRLDRLNAGAPFLKVHELDTLDAVIGSVVPGSARIENGRGIALVRISERADVEPIWRDIQAGHIRAVSIGYQVHRFEVSKPEAARELWRAVDWTPFEVSAVAVGADPAAVFRAHSPLHDCVLHHRDAPSSTKGPIPMTDKTETPASEAAKATTTTQPTEPVETEDTPMTEPKAAAPEPKGAAVETRSQPTTQATPAPDTEAVATRAREAERDRVSTIYDLAGRLNLERGFAEDLVKRGVSVDESRRLILDQVAAKSDETRTFPHVSVPLGGRDERITRRDAVANALLHRYSPTLFQLEDTARQYRGMTLLELARESLGIAGVNTRGLSRDEVATRALHSTSDFPEILSAVTNKTLRQAYDAYPRTFMLFCRQVLATDFKAMHRVQLGEAPQLLEVGESGEFKRGTLGRGSRCGPRGDGQADRPRQEDGAERPPRLPDRARLAGTEGRAAGGSESRARRDVQRGAAVDPDAGADQRAPARCRQRDSLVSGGQSEPDRHHRVRLSRGPARRLHRDAQRLRRRRRRDQVPPRLRRQGHRLARTLQKCRGVSRHSLHEPEHAGGPDGPPFVFQEGHPPCEISSSPATPSP